MARKKKKTASKIPAEVMVVAVTVTDVESSCCCGHVFQKQLCDLNLELGNQRWCVKKEDSSERTEEGSASVSAATEAASVTGAERATEAAVETKGYDICRCCDDLEKFWCEEYLKLGLGRRCTEFEESSEATEDSEEKTEEVNHFRLVWKKDETL